MKVDRTKFLSELEAVTPGLSTKEVVEYSSCFVFDGKQVKTYNSEIACFQDCKVPIQGAVHATRFLALLRKMKEETIDINVTDNTVHVLGKRRRHGQFPLEQGAELPVGSIKSPKHWHDLPADFLEGIRLVGECLEKDESDFRFACLYLHPEHIDRCGRFEVARFKVALELKNPLLVRKESIKHITSLGMTRFGVSKSWIHFANPNGLSMACLMWREQYPEIAGLLKVKGQRLQLPKALEAALDRAAVVAEDGESNHVFISITNGKIEVVGESIHGKWCEHVKAAYRGSCIGFTISPTLLTYILKNYNDCILSKEKLKVKSGRFRYITTLGTPDINNEQQGKQGDGETENEAD